MPIPLATSTAAIIMVLFDPDDPVAGKPPVAATLTVKLSVPPDVAYDAVPVNVPAVVGAVRLAAAVFEAEHVADFA